MSEKQKQFHKSKSSGAAGNRQQQRTQPKKDAPFKTNKRTTNQQVAKQSAEDIAVGERIVVTIKRIGINGEGVGYYKRKAVFIDGAITDEVVKAKVTKVERSFLQAELIDIEKKSPHRQKPPCPVYEQCGGCQLQHMTYEAQLSAKEEIVKEAFSRYARMDQLPMRPILGMDKPWQYRNKAQLQAGLNQGDVIAGLYAKGSHQLIDISDCSVQDPLINEVIQTVKSILQELDIPIYDERSRRGVVKTIVARVARQSKKLQLTLVTAVDELPAQRALIGAIRREFPMVISIAQNIHKEKSSLVFGPRTKILWGEERLPETLGELQFELSPRAFFQLNPVQTVKLYNLVKEAAALTGKETVIDAYCGTGTIGLWLAKDAKEVRGIESIGEAVMDARRNAEHSGITNARFYEGFAEQLIPTWMEQGIHPDVIVVDPPRTGLDQKLIDTLLSNKPKRIVYVSCNPSTLAKDCAQLLKDGYKLNWLQPVDMFPQSSHCESVALLVYTGETKK